MESSKVHPLSPHEASSLTHPPRKKGKKKVKEPLSPKHPEEPDVKLPMSTCNRVQLKTHTHTQALTPTLKSYKQSRPKT